MTDRKIGDTFVSWVCCSHDLAVDEVDHLDELFVMSTNAFLTNEGVEWAEWAEVSREWLPDVYGRGPGLLFTGRIVA